MRASMAAEKAGFPSVSVVSTGFLIQAKAVAEALGVRGAAIAEYPGLIMLDSKETLADKINGVVAENVIKGFAQPVSLIEKKTEPDPRDIIFEGQLDEVHEYFYSKLWTDGLPVIPPTLERVEKFLKFTTRNPGEVIGTLLPENRQATIWSVAVNGVMAGCRPEYMPVLIAVVEAIAEPRFHIKDAGSTPGWEPLIILNGPIIKELNFNYETGVMRVGRQANTSIGRFLRLYMRNIAGLRIPPGLTDKATFGTGNNCVLAENEDVINELGWEPFSVTQGFKRAENVVTVQSVENETCSIASGGDKAVDHLQTFAEVIGGTMGYWTTLAVNWGAYFPLIVISPMVARSIAKDGLKKEDIQQYLYDHSKISARSVHRLAWQSGCTDLDLCKAVQDGLLPKEYCLSDDPDRMVPVFIHPEWIGVVVSGDPGRNRNKGYVQNHQQGPPVSKKIELPPNWHDLLNTG